jgi:hypothetical protein
MSKTYGNKSALKHGAFTEVVILPGEDPNELKELRAALYDEWNPEGPTEIDKVESIAMGIFNTACMCRVSTQTTGNLRRERCKATAIMARLPIQSA